MNLPLEEVIKYTPFWKPVENYHLSRAKKSLDHFSDSVFRSYEDILALIRCLGWAGATGKAAVTSSLDKHEFNKTWNETISVKEKIGLLRNRLDEHKKFLSL